jgi:hypothetical protein
MGGGVGAGSREVGSFKGDRMRRVTTSAAVALAFLVMAGCEKTGGVARPSAASIAANAKIFAKPTTCMMNPGVNRCANVLAANFRQTRTTQQQYDDLVGLFGSATPSNYAERDKYDPACSQKRPKHRILSAQDAAQMPDPHGWANSLWIAMGKFEPEDNDNECAEKLYRVGGIPGASYFLVAELKTQGSHAKGTMLGTWYMVAYSDGKAGKEAKLLQSGSFVLCKHSHAWKPEGYGEFQDCPQKDTISTIADTSRDVGRAVLEVIAEMRRDSFGIADTGVRLASAITISPPDRMRLFQSGAANTDNPAWISCALGCCVMVDPTEPTGPWNMVDASAKPTSRRSSRAFAVR